MDKIDILLKKQQFYKNCTLKRMEKLETILDLRNWTEKEEEDYNLQVERLKKIRFFINEIEKVICNY